MECARLDPLRLVLAFSSSLRLVVPSSLVALPSSAVLLWLVVPSSLGLVSFWLVLVLPLF